MKNHWNTFLSVWHKRLKWMIDMKPKHRIFASFMSSLNCTILFLPLFVLKLNGKLLKHWWRSFSLQTDCYYRTDDFRWQWAREAAKLHLSFAKVIVWNFATAESTLEAAKLSSNFSLSTLFYLIASLPITKLDFCNSLMLLLVFSFNNDKTRAAAVELETVKDAEAVLYK